MIQQELTHGAHPAAALDRTQLDQFSGVHDPTRRLDRLVDVHRAGQGLLGHDLPGGRVGYGQLAFAALDIAAVDVITAQVRIPARGIRTQRIRLRPGRCSN